MFSLLPTVPPISRHGGTKSAIAPYIDGVACALGASASSLTSIGLDLFKISEPGTSSSILTSTTAGGAKGALMTAGVPGVGLLTSIAQGTGIGLACGFGAALVIYGLKKYNKELNSRN